MQQKPFLINAILGNSRMLVTLTEDGEIQRLFWPHIDGGQQVERVLGGISVDGRGVVWQDDRAWRHEQAYERDQNVLQTVSSLGEGLEIRTVDAVTPGRDLLLRHLTFTNRSSVPVALQYVLYQWVRVDENPLYNTVLFDDASDSLVHFRRDVFVAAGSDRPMSTMVLGDPERTRAAAASLHFTGGAPHHGDMAGACAWDLGTLAPGQSVSLALFWAFGRNIAEVRTLLAEARGAGAGELLDEARAYWAEWLSRARPLHAATDHQAMELYRRSLLVFKLMSDEQTGAVIAAPEFDPAFTSCGGYAYCWGRDAAYITVAMDQAGYHDMAAAFYRWAVGAQEPGGWWMHRHYASGHWGPSWGLIQVDETGSILYGMAVHARLHGGREFARSVWPCVKLAADWLAGNLDPENGLPAACVDLWEERTAQPTYSSAAVFAGLRSAAELADMLGEAEAGDRYRAVAEQLRQAILAECVLDGVFLRGRYLEVTERAYLDALASGKPVRQRRGPKGHAIFEVTEDPVPDTSLLGLAVPFGLVAADDPVMVNTAERLVSALWTEGAGGMRRYADDQYRGGNPWVLCSLWLGLYAAERGDVGLAHQILDWAAARRTATGLLPEQVDPETGRPAWVLPLTWSHAMYVLLALKLYAGNSGSLDFRDGLSHNVSHYCIPFLMAKTGNQ